MVVLDKEWQSILIHQHCKPSKIGTLWLWLCLWVEESPYGFRKQYPTASPVNSVASTCLELVASLQDL